MKSPLASKVALVAIFIPALFVVFFESTPLAHASGPVELYSTSLYSNANLKGYWRLQNNANDATPNGANGTDTNVSYVSGQFGSAANYTGTSSYTGIPDNSALHLGPGSRTISFWIKTSSGATNQNFIGNRNDNSTWWRVFTKDSTHFYFEMGNSYPSHYKLSTSNAITYADGSWHHVAVVTDGSNIYWYFDGASAGTDSWSSFSTDNSNGEIQFGASHHGGYIDWYDGSLDDIAVFNGALSAGEIAELHDGIPRISLLAQYKSDAITSINEGSSTTENIVTFSGHLDSLGTSTLQLQVEVKPSGTGFSGSLTTTSVAVSPGNNATATYELFPGESSDDDYHWQARVYDGSQYSAWQAPVSAATTTVDFVIDTVPLYTQITSIYPNATDSATWASSTYDDALPGTQCPATGGGANSSTIAACGCSISSVVMTLRYFGITTNASGTDVNPATLDDWLTNNGGYTSDGSLQWDHVPLYAEESGQFTVSSTVIAASGSSSTLSSTVDSYLAQSSPIPLILTENNTPIGGGQTELHFVVATGFANHSSVSTYTTRDSNWYKTAYLNQATTTQNLSTVKYYHNDYDGIHGFIPMPGFGGDASTIVEQIRSGESSPYQAKGPLFNDYAINTPNALILVDAEGRRTGKDPATGTIYHEIPGTSYVEEGRSGQLHLSALATGQYAIYILGGATGTYHLDSWVSDGQHPALPQRISGSITSGEMIAYTQNYNAANLASSTLIFESTASSSIKVTSMPSSSDSPVN